MAWLQAQKHLRVLLSTNQSTLVLQHQTNICPSNGKYLLIAEAIKTYLAWSKHA